MVKYNKSTSLLPRPFPLLGSTAPFPFSPDLSCPVLSPLLLPTSASASVEALQPPTPLWQIHINQAVVHPVLARWPRLHLGFDLEFLLLPPATLILLPFGCLVCSSFSPSILLQPTHRVVFHLGLSIFDDSTTLAGELAVADTYDVLAVTTRKTDICTSWEPSFVPVIQPV